MLAGICCGLAVPAALGTGNIKGHCRFEKIKGKPAMGYAELYESNLFLSPPDGTPVGPSRRLGASCGDSGTCSTQIITGDGCYCIDSMPAGIYSILVDQPIFFITPKVLGNVVIQDGQTITVNPELPVDYSTYFTGSSAPYGWTGGSDNWYQTFTATGTAVRGIAFKVASGVGGANVYVLKDNGNSNPTLWDVLGSRRTDYVNANADSWVRWRSADIPLIPGTRYAVRLQALVSGALQPYKRDKDGNSYVGGQAYDKYGNSQPFDLNITVFADNDGTCVTMNRRTSLGSADYGALIDGNFARKWAQTFTAQGSSLAGVEVWAAGANSEWNLDFTWTVHDGDSPTAPIIGPIKTTQAAPQTWGTGQHAVSYNNREVPLVRGNVYCIEFATLNPPPDSPGFNPYMNVDDPYDGGHGWIWDGASWNSRPGDDTNMTIVEYAAGIRLVPQAIALRIYPGDNAPDGSFQIVNDTGTAMAYSVGVSVDPGDPAWLSVAPTSGTVGSTQDIAIHYSTASLPLGPHVGNITVTAPNAPDSPQVVTVTATVQYVAPDFDQDGDVDMIDFAHLQACFTGSGVHITDETCRNADLDSNDDVSSGDFGVFLKCLTGTGVDPPHTCDQ